METLRQTIKTLFQLQKSDNVIASLLKGKCHDDAHVNRQWFVRAYLDDELNAGNITAEQWWYWYAMEYSSKVCRSPVV